MPDFSVILQTPVVRGIVQEGLLERAFHDALFPKMLFRSEVAAVPWPAGIGDNQIFSAPGLMDVDCQPLVPGRDPDVGSYPIEQWEATLQKYGKAIDTHMPTSAAAIADLFMRNAQQLGLQAGQTVNRIVRNRMYAASLSGSTVCETTGAATVVRVKRLNGFTRARRPDLAAGSAVRFNPVSSSNPLPVKVFDNGVETANTIVAFAADTPGDEAGPGTVTFGTITTNLAARAYLIADDRTVITRVGGGNSVDSLTAGTDIPTMSDIRNTVSVLRQQNAPEHPDGRFHCHHDPKSEALLAQDAEFQRMLTALPDYFIYKKFTIGELLGCVFFRNNECPNKDTVLGGTTATFSQSDPFVGELFVGGVTTGSPVHRMLFTAQGAIMEYFQDYGQLMSEAGITGKVGEARINNNGIDVLTERIQMIIRSPLNRLQDLVSAAWQLTADWPVRTDAAVGSPPRYKRFAVIEHCE